MALHYQCWPCVCFSSLAIDPSVVSFYGVSHHRRRPDSSTLTENVTQSILNPMRTATLGSGFSGRYRIATTIIIHIA